MPATEFHIDIIQPDCRATALLAEHSGLSITQIKQAMQKGAVWLSNEQGTNRLRRAKKKLPVGAQLHFYYNPQVLEASIEEPVLLADEGDYSVWIKPRGVFSQGSKWGDHCTITRWIETNDSQQRPAFPIHRLDRAATGLMLIGHGKNTTKQLSELFAKKLIHKVYQAVVNGHFSKPGEILTYNKDIDGRKTVTHARLLEYNQEMDHSLVEVIIETGRKHQIRRHLSEAGFAILGDRLYAGGDEQDLQLAAVSLAFRCPVYDEDKSFHLPDSFRPSLG